MQVMNFEWKANISDSYSHEPLNIIVRNKNRLLAEALYEIVHDLSPSCWGILHDKGIVS